MYDNSEQLPEEVMMEHCDKSVSVPLQFISPEIISTLVSDDRGAFLVWDCVLL